MSTSHPTLCAIGDVHGHLQLGLAVAARWQRELGIRFDAVLLCGDIGSFTDDRQLDSTTRRHARTNPCELEFLLQWAKVPQPPHLARIFAATELGGLGLTCPVVMTHGNHEGFASLERLAARAHPDRIMTAEELPHADSAGHVRYLPSGCRFRTERGLVVATVGGIERGQRAADYHPMAYIDEAHVLQLLDAPSFDVLFTHQGPASTQCRDKGSPSIETLLDERKMRVWFHGHSIPDPVIQRLGPDQGTLVVPLADVAFPGRGEHADDPDPHEMGWCWVRLDDERTHERTRPGFWRDYRRRRWTAMPDGQLIAPDLARAPW